MAKRKSTAIQKEADRLFSRFIRARDGMCLRCGKTENLQCHHLLTRAYRKVRFDERNGVTVCVGCHAFLTHRPLENEEFAIGILGEETWNELKAVARSVDYRVDLKDVLAELRKKVAA